MCRATAPATGSHPPRPPPTWADIRVSGRLQQRLSDTVSTSADAVIADLNARILPEVLSGYPGVFYTFEGAMAEQRDALGGLQRGFTLALLMIFALLAVPLRSYVQPLIIMSAIPFGLIGAVWGHVFLGLNVSIMSMFGLIALTGVVVNDSLIMVFFGLAPLMWNRSLDASFMVPMAVSLGFGVLFAPLITLVLVPTAYMILDDVGRTMRRIGGREPATGPGVLADAREERGHVVGGREPATGPGVLGGPTSRARSAATSGSGDDSQGRLPATRRRRTASDALPSHDQPASRPRSKPWWIR